MWEGIKGIFGAGLEFVGSIFSLMWEKICEIFGGVKEWFHEKFTGAWNAVKKVFSGVGSFFGGIWNTIVGKFKDIGVKVGNAVGGAFKGAINAVITFAQNIINGFIGGINKVMSRHGKIMEYVKSISQPQSHSKGCGVCRRHFHEALSGIRATSKLELSALKHACTLC